MSKAELENLVADQQTLIQQLQNENGELKGRTATKEADTKQTNTLYNKLNNLSIGKE